MYASKIQFHSIMEVPGHNAGTFKNTLSKVHYQPAEHGIIIAAETGQEKTAVNLFIPWTSIQLIVTPKKQP